LSKHDLIGRTIKRKSIPPESVASENLRKTAAAESYFEIIDSKQH
jgi:hypothetical protein